MITFSTLGTYFRSQVFWQTIFFFNPWLKMSVVWIADICDLFQIVYSIISFAIISTSHLAFNIKAQAAVSMLDFGGWESHCYSHTFPEFYYHLRGMMQFHAYTKVITLKYHSPTVVEGITCMVNNRWLMVLTDQADPGCFYFRKLEYWWNDIVFF